MLSLSLLHNIGVPGYQPGHRSISVADLYLATECGFAPHLSYFTICVFGKGLGAPCYVNVSKYGVYKQPNCKCFRHLCMTMDLMQLLKSCTLCNWQAISVLSAFSKNTF